VIVFGAIAPHGDPAFVEGSATRNAFDELGRRLASAEPDVTIVVTPHNVHVEGAFAVITAASLAGSLDEPELELGCAVDRELAARVLEALREEELPAAGVSYGSNDEALAEMPMDWGTLVPLWFLGGRAKAPAPVVVVSPARDRPLQEHVRAGAAIARACERRRAALVASADHGHAHDPDGPFGFHPAAAEFDERMVELVGQNRLVDALGLEEIVGEASADSLWQVLVLHGALDGGFTSELLSYERPTYFGMLCAAFEQR
jgi:aromatic ring-opening dioxygenase LigB subunit